MRKLVRFCFVLLLMLLPATARAQVTYDNSAYSNCEPCSSLTYSLTVASGSNRQLLVWTFVSSANFDQLSYVTSVTYNGVSLVQIAARGDPGANNRAELWALPAGTQPASGTHNVVVTLNATGEEDSFHSGAMSVAGVDQTQTFTSVRIDTGGAFSNTTTGAAFHANAAVPYTLSNDLLFEAVWAGNEIDATSQTQRFLNNVGSGTACDNNGLSTAAGGTTYLQWAVNASAANGDKWMAISGSIRAAATATTLQLKNGSLQVVADTGSSTPVTPLNWVQNGMNLLNDGSNSNTTSVTMNSSPTTGNALVCITMVGANDAISTITDTQSNTYHHAIGYYDSTTATDMEIWYTSGITGGSSFTITPTWASSTTLFRYINCSEYAGIISSSPLDQTASYTPSDNDISRFVGPFTTNYDYELVFYADRDGCYCNYNDNVRSVNFSDYSCDFIQYTAGQTTTMCQNPIQGTGFALLATFRTNSAKAQVK